MKTLVQSLAVSGALILAHPAFAQIEANQAEEVIEFLDTRFEPWLSQTLDVLGVEAELGEILGHPSLRIAGTDGSRKYVIDLYSDHGGTVAISFAREVSSTLWTDGASFYDVENEGLIASISVSDSAIVDELFGPGPQWLDIENWSSFESGASWRDAFATPSEEMSLAAFYDPEHPGWSDGSYMVMGDGDSDGQVTGRREPRTGQREGRTEEAAANDHNRPNRADETPPAPTTVIDAAEAFFKINREPRRVDFTVAPRGTRGGTVTVVFRFGRTNRYPPVDPTSAAPPTQVQVEEPEWRNDVQTMLDCMDRGPDCYGQQRNAAGVLKGWCIEIDEREGYRFIGLCEEEDLLSEPYDPEQAENDHQGSDTDPQTDSETELPPELERLIEDMVDPVINPDPS